MFNVLAESGSSAGGGKTKSKRPATRKGKVSKPTRKKGGLSTIVKQVSQAAQKTGKVIQFPRGGRLGERQG